MMMSCDPMLTYVRSEWTTGFVYSRRMSHDWATITARGGLSGGNEQVVRA